MENVLRMAEVFSKAMGLKDAEGATEAFRTAIRFGMCLVAEDGEIMGTACLTPYTKVAWVGGVAVRPELQGRGIGRALVIRLLNLVRFPTVRLDATEVGKHLYRKLGFSEEYRTVTYDLSWVHPTHVETVEGLEDWMLELDKEAFGDDRSALLETSGGIALKAERGFGVLSRGLLGQVVAEDEGSAEAVIRGAVALGARYLVAPSYRSGFLESIGAREVYRCTRMSLGRHREASGLLYGIYGYMFG
ncbi:GNAT family N-acetyltransferase [Sulfodiicoccus acidiphilus]|uniref:GNAT family N-acetyltransferase n=1 Tax=Sulfodiicoccus acidiphilus TaxID=1670455 RepID=A0A348B1J2_9CREN|nr:GNAT family N-acetyltransferase [Sulfodiicoccus acidiphilus]GGU00198.1 GNAT family N-acetyltransferase [Sulfodiicoccus acidiphilus]